MSGARNSEVTEADQQIWLVSENSSFCRMFPFMHFEWPSFHNETVPNPIYPHTLSMSFRIYGGTHICVKTGGSLMRHNRL